MDYLAQFPVEQFDQYFFDGFFLACAFAFVGWAISAGSKIIKP